MKPVVDFWFDAACPFAWVTSRWIREVARVREIQVCWRVMSLAILNENRNLNPSYREFIDQTWFPARAAAQVSVEYGSDVLGDFYTILGTAFHYEANNDYQGVTRHALEELKLDPRIADLAFDSAIDGQLRELHNEGIALVGDNLGTPIVSVDGRAFFGPVLTRIPRGEEAGLIFDSIVTLTSNQYFFELKRERTSRPDFSMSELERRRDLYFRV